jgi:hypothetical protein
LKVTCSDWGFALAHEEATPSMSRPGIAKVSRLSPEGPCSVTVVDEVDVVDVADIEDVADVVDEEPRSSPPQAAVRQTATRSARPDAAVRVMVANVAISAIESRP